jgi:hypothetical protein
LKQYKKLNKKSFTSQYLPDFEDYELLEELKEERESYQD